jgi:hypothetical protein
MESSNEISFTSISVDTFDIPEENEQSSTVVQVPLLKIKLNDVRE